MHRLISLRIVQYRFSRCTLITRFLQSEIPRDYLKS